MAALPASSEVRADFNGDGFGDLVMMQNRAARVAYGSAEGLSPGRTVFLDVGVLTEPPGPELDHGGYGVTTAAADFNGDGYTDLAVGVGQTDIGDQGNAGAVYVTSGSAQGLDPKTRKRWTQNSAGRVSSQVGFATCRGSAVGRGWPHTHATTTRKRVAMLAGFALAVSLFGQTPAAYAALPTCEDRPATIVGTAGDDSITGTAGADVIVGLGGDDRIRGEDGDDIICGGNGKDLLSGGEGIDSIHGGNGNDDIRLGPNPLKFWTDPESGEEGEIFEWGDGDAGNDTIDGGSGDDEIYGSGGDDRIKGGAGWDNLDGEAGDDVLGGGTEGDNLYGGAGSDRAYGGASGDYWNGSGNKSGDVDHFYGGSGDDYAEAGDRGRQVLRGGPGDDDLNGGNKSDVIIGGSGDDLLTGYLGSDKLRGGSGTDTVDYSRTTEDDGGSSGGSSAPIRVDLQRQTATGVGTDTLSSIEGVVPGGGQDVLLGSDGSDIFTFTGDNYAEDDFEKVLPGDVIKGRGGSDTILSQDESEGCCELLRIDLTAGKAQYVGQSSFARLSSIENAVGGSDDDVLIGNGKANVLRGGDGDDQIDGAAGNDRLFGGGDADSIKGGAGNDVLSGGAGQDRNDGGPGQDRCTSPSSGSMVASCEPGAERRSR
jgi:Ca2+-binding RTX toxin-like protein